MPLASKDGKLYVKTEIDENGNEIQKLCTSCCGDTPVVGKCCSYPYNSSGPQPANTAEEAIQLASQSASANSAAIPNSIWTVGTPFGVPWVEGEAWYDAERDQYVCVGYWTQGNPAVCTNETQEQCTQSGPFRYFTPGETCENPADCPEFPPQPSGICLYREDGLGTCWGYGIEGEELPQLFATEEEAQAYIDAGGCPDNDPSAPACAKCWCYPYKPATTPETPWAIIQECVVYTDEYDEFGNETGNYICEKTIYLSNCTEEECQAQAEANPLSGIEWRNDKPADKCKIVNSEDECTESTGTFCPDLTECPDDPSAGCPDPNRSNPLP